MPFQIVRNDITRMKVDAIVNTANPHPVIGAGTDHAIHSAAGPQLLEARKAIGDIAPGCAVETPAFDLDAKYVLHTVGPFWQGGERGETALLRRAYDAALTLADRLGCASVAFPLMAAGSYAFPREVAMKTAIGAFTDFLLDHEMTIYLVVFGKRATGLAGSLFDGVKNYIDDHYANEKAREEYGDYDVLTERPRADWIRRREAILSTSQAYRPNAAPDMAAAPPGGAASKRKAKPAQRPEAEADAETAAGSLEDYLRLHESTFPEYLIDLLRERGGKDSTVYHRAQISKQLFNKIINNKDYHPKKNTVIQLAIGLRLNLPQTQALLGKAGYVLTSSNKADLVVQYYISRGVFNVVEINIALFDCGLPPLSTGLVS